MDATEQVAAHRVGLVDVVRALPGLAVDAPKMVHGALGLLTLRPSARESVGHVFQRLANRHPDRPFLRFGSRELSYGQANAQVNRYAAVLAGRGVGQGSVVGLLATNRPETLLVALAVVKLGATAGMLNHNQRGEVLDHSQRLLDSKVLVVGAECAEALDSLSDVDIVGEVLGLSGLDGSLPGHPDLDAEAADAPVTDPPQCAEVRASTKAFYIFTSGTTGLPKASTMSHFRWLKGMTGLGRLGVRLNGQDTLYCCLPLYHNNALTVSLSSVLAAGACMALGRSFSASRFWDDVVGMRATAFCYIGELCRYLLNQPVRPAERQHQVRVVVGNGLRPEIWTEFTERFAIPRVAEFYGASECNLAFVNALNLDRTAGICPLPFAVVRYDPSTGRAARDERGRASKVRAGEVGLLLTKITSRAPFDGYTDPQATERKLVRDAFRSGDCWFDTGDLVRDQGWSHVSFVDRLGDTFRWKGENVATTEVEAALAEFEGVEQAVVYGVAVPASDGRAGMATIKLRAGSTLDGVALAAHLVGKLPHYAVPLFLRVVDAVEQTSTFKSRKVNLREEGYDPDRVSDPLYVLAGRADGYVEAYPGYAEDVSAGRIRV
ncbi:fatty-acyl-CoA synthase [Kutzneria viridogrisea]|nr:long-chain-acyl-CoA synthetase [Kutzneria albida]MBA8924839.1 fatty-acyl-CoA synthase [Kutzneria viridogrisea]